MTPKLPPNEKHTNRQISFSGEVNDFLDQLPKRTVSSFIEILVRETDEFKRFREGL